MSAREKSIAFTSYYPRELLEQLEELAQQTHIPKAHHLREALRQHLENQGRLPRPLLEFCGERVPVIISARQPQHGSLPEMYALMELSDYLYPTQLDVYLSNDKILEPTGVLEGSFIALGGPDKNRVSAKILQSLSQQMAVHMFLERQDDGRVAVIKNQATGEKWRADEVEMEAIPHDFSDYGLIVKAPLAQGEGAIVICAGCHAFGTHAAVRALTLPRTAALMQRLLREPDGYFEAVVQARVRNFCPQLPAVADLHPLAAG